jgi:AraC-like DNA-binding protein
MAVQQVSFAAIGRPSTADDSFAAYHDLYAPVADVVRLEGAFSVKVAAHRIGEILAFDRQLKGVGHSRSPKRVAQNAFDHFTVQLALRGSFQISTEAGNRIVEQGALALIDMTRWMRTDAPDANILTLSIPRERLDALMGDAGRLHGVILPANRAILLSEFVLSFLRNEAKLNASDRSRVERVTTELLAIALSDRSDMPSAAPEAAGDVLCRTRAKKFIDANLACTPEDVGRAIGRSRSALYRAFHPVGGLAAYIQTRRLVRLRAMLVAPGETRRISELAAAAGFSSDSHCARVFKASFGLSPSEYRLARTEALQADERSGAAHQVLAQWWGDLR